MRRFAYPLQIIGLSAIIVFYILPLLMLPFVNELPYLHQWTLWQRCLISISIFSISYLLGWLGASPRNRKLAARMNNGIKERVGTWLGFFMFVFFGAFWSANSMGLLVLYTLPTKPYLERVVVTEAKDQGSKYKSVYLNLHSQEDGKNYYLTLSKKLFDYPRINAGDKMILKGQKNLFGIYVNNYELD